MLQPGFGVNGDAGGANRDVKDALLTLVVLPGEHGRAWGLGVGAVWGVCSFGPAKGVPPALCRLLGSCPSFGSLGETTCPRPVEVIVDIPPSPLGCKTCKPPFLC